MNPDSINVTTVHLNTGPAEELSKVSALQSQGCNRPIIRKAYTVINVTTTLDL